MIDDEREREDFADLFDHIYEYHTDEVNNKQFNDSKELNKYHDKLHEAMNDERMPNGEWPGHE